MDGSSPPAAVPGCSSPRVTCEHSYLLSSSPGDRQGQGAVNGDTELCPKAHAKGSASPGLLLPGLLLPKTFLSRN